MSTDTQPSNRLYFAVLRGHFHARLYVIPLLLMLATTGLIMLWIAVVTGIGDEKLTIPRKDAPLAVSALIAAAEAAGIATVAVWFGEVATGVTMNPYSGEVLNQFRWRAGWYDWLTDIHGSLLIGDTGDGMIEAAASLGLLLVMSGSYLHWPRNGWGRALTVQTRAQGRAFWKSLHGAVGLWVNVLLVVFLISGLS